MRLNKFIAQATGLSRRAADTAISEGRALIDGQPATLGTEVTDSNTVVFDGKPLTAHTDKLTLLLNKPVGYVCSRNGQGSKTIYDIIPSQYHHLKPVGRLDKDSSGLLLLTNDGDLAYELTHPSKHKIKIYEIELDKALTPLHRQMIQDYGITLDDGVSKLALGRREEGDDRKWQVTMHEGRNRQIRRTFASLGYTVTALHRTNFGSWALHGLKPGEYQV